MRLSNRPSFPLRRGALLSALLAGVAGCPGDGGDTLDPPDTGTPTGGADSATSGGNSSADTGPAACPDNPDPECTTSNACGNNEICVACKCVQQTAECSDPANANCMVDADCPALHTCTDCICTALCNPSDPNECYSDDDCASSGGTCQVNDSNLCVCQGGQMCDPTIGDCLGDSDCSTNETCVDCACVSSCECNLTDSPCANAGDTCDGCNCAACGSGMASPVDFMGVETPEIIVTGTMITGYVTGAVEACADPVCLVQVANNLATPVMYTTANDPLAGDPVFLSPDTGMIDPGGTMVLEVQTNACNVTGDLTDAIFLQDADTLAEYGEVDFAITLVQAS